jgi:hypothetical protein
LSGLALAQPLFDLMSNNAELFVSLNISRRGVVLWTLLVVLTPPLALWVLEVLVGLALPAARRWAHAVLCGAVASVLAVESLKEWTGLPSLPLIVLGAAAGVGLGALVLRSVIARTWLRYLAFAPVAFSVLFLFFSPVTEIVRNDGAETARVQVGKPSRVVMVVLDEFPTASLLDGNGRVDADLFPNFATLERASNWYRNNSTVAPYTNQAVPAILSGDYPDDPNKVAVASAYPRNLFTLLGNTYDMNVHESATRLCPRALCTGTGTASKERFKSLVSDSLKLWRDFASPERKSTQVGFAAAATDQEAHALPVGQRFVGSLRPATEPRLDFLHLLLPHWPWHYVDENKDQGVQPLRGTYTYRWVSDWTALSGRQRHLLQVQAADMMLGRIISKLRRIGAWDDSLVVVTTDHGAAFTKNEPIRGASAGNFPQIMWTPLFVKLPGQTVGRMDDRPAHSIDLLPTIADVLDVRMPWKVDGHSVLGPPADDGARRLFRWFQNDKSPARGGDFLEFDGPTGFSRTLAARASSATGDPALRLYKIGPYGDLIGREVPAGGDAAGLTASLDDPGRFQRVDPTSRRVPWTQVSGTIDCPPSETPLAVAVNGTVAGLTASYDETPGDPDGCTFWAELVPGLFRPGANEITLFAISGPPGAPVLKPLTVR